MKLRAQGCAGRANSPRGRSGLRLLRGRRRDRRVRGHVGARLGRNVPVDSQAAHEVAVGTGDRGGRAVADALVGRHRAHHLLALDPQLCLCVLAVGSTVRVGVPREECVRTDLEDPVGDALGRTLAVAAGVAGLAYATRLLPAGDGEANRSRRRDRRRLDDEAVEGDPLGVCRRHTDDCQQDECQQSQQLGRSPVEKRERTHGFLLELPLKEPDVSGIARTST